MRHEAFLLLALVCAVTAMPLTAQAETANELAAEAGAAYVAGDRARAASLYERAYDLDPYPLWLFAAGKTRYELGECAAAIEHLERFRAAGTDERVGETKAILDACKRQQEAVAERARVRTELEASIRAAVAAGDCRVAAALQERRSKLAKIDEENRRLGELVGRCRPSVTIERVRTPWHRRRVVIGGMIGGVVIGLSGGTFLWLGDRAARDATEAANAGEPLETVADHARAAHDRRVAGAWVLGSGGLVIAASYALHRWFPEWHDLEVRASPRGAEMSWSLRF